MPEEAVLDAPSSAPAEVSTPAAAPATPIEIPSADAAEIEAVETFVAEPEVPAADAKVGDGKEVAVEAAKPAEPAKPPIEDFSWDPTPGVKILNNALNGSPVLKAELDKNPALKNLVFANASARDEAFQYREHFLSPEQAKEAATRSTRLAGYEAAFQGTPKTFDDILRQTDTGRYYALTEHHAIERRAEFRKHAEAGQRHDWLEALDLIEQAENEIRGTTAPTDLEALPADVKAKLEQAKTTQLQVEKAEADANRVREQSVVTACRDAVRQRHMPYLKQISGSLPEATVDGIFATAYKEFGKLAMSNDQFKISQKTLYDTTKGDDTVKQISTLAANSSAVMRTILSKLVREEAKKFVDASKAKHVVQERRVQEHREPKGPPAAGAPVQAQPSTAEVMDRAEKLKADLYKSGLVLSSRLTSEERVAAVDGSLFRKFADIAKSRLAG